MGGWRCRSCGQVHDELPMPYGGPAPVLWFTLPETEREKRVLLSANLCLIDGQHGFLVGNLEIPVVDGPESFSWGVWVSLSLTTFKRAYHLWQQPS